jgi:hypothetical protein
MSNQSQPEKSQQAGFFGPAIDDLKSAQKAGRQGATMCLLITAMTALSNISAVGTVERSGALIVVLLVYGGLAVMIYKMSRAAAILAMLIYFGDCLIMVSQQGISVGMFVRVLIFFGFINSVQGTFAYHRFRHQRQATLQEVEVPQSNS